MELCFHADASEETIFQAEFSEECVAFINTHRKRTRLLSEQCLELLDMKFAIKYVMKGSRHFYRNLRG